MIFSFKHDKNTIKFKLTDPNDFLSQQIIQFNTFYERRYLNFIQKFSNKLIRRSHALILDVGAHMGNHTIFFSKVLNHRVYSFEPQIEMYESLCKNIQINHIAHLVNAKNIAISNHKCRLNVVKRYDRMAGSTQWWYENKKNKNLNEKNKINSDKLDNIIKQRVDFIKIDVEGMEIEVLKGANNIIQKYNPVIMIEITDIDNKGNFRNNNLFNEWLKKYRYIKVGTKYFNRNTHLIIRKGSVFLPKEVEEIGK